MTSDELLAVQEGDIVLSGTSYFQVDRIHEPTVPAAGGEVLEGRRWSETTKTWGPVKRWHYNPQLAAHPLHILDDDARRSCGFPPRAAVDATTVTPTANTATEITDLDTAISFSSETAKYTDTVSSTLDDVAGQLDTAAQGLAAEAAQYAQAKTALAGKGFGAKVTAKFDTAAEALNLAAQALHGSHDQVQSASEQVGAAGGEMRSANTVFTDQLALADSIGAAQQEGGVAKRTDFYGPAHTGGAGPTAPRPGSPVMDTTESDSAEPSAAAAPESDTAPQPAKNVALPAEAAEAVCPQCGAGMYPDPKWPAEVRESDGSASVSLLCSASCGSPGRLYRWQVPKDQYQAIYGEVPDNLLLPGDDRLLPPAPDARSLPPGPWGYFKVEPSPIPDEAWEMACTNKVGRWKTRECGAILIPDPKRVFYYDEFTSSATVGYRCPVCKVSLENFKWPLTLDEHYAIFGRSPDDYVPEYDPTDESDFQALYSMWQTEDRGMLTHYATIDQLAGSPDLDLRTIGPGEFTIKHWPTGVTWDVPDFVAQHEQVIADYDKYYAEDEPESDGEDEEE